jgi:hypothetical protein
MRPDEADVDHEEFVFTATMTRYSLPLMLNTTRLPAKKLADEYRDLMSSGPVQVAFSTSANQA